jgi:hypothetical protein
VAENIRAGWGSGGHWLDTSAGAGVLPAGDKA